MKKITNVIAIAILLFGCSAKNSTDNSNVNEEKVYKNAYLDYEDIEEIYTNADLVGINIEDSSEIYKAAKYIVIATVESIDGGGNKNLITGEYVYPYTYGTIFIDKVYKGDIEEGSTLNYIRSGGIISYQDWYDSLSQAKKDKHDYLSKGVNPKYVKSMFNDDIDIEPGKTYLMYMEDANSRSNNEYMIAAWQAGLREVSGLESMTSDGYSSLKVLNNYTGEYESLDDVLK